MSAAGLTTADPSYDLPLRCKITLLSNDNTTTLITYDSFNPTANNTKVIQVLVSLAMNQTGTFSIFIEDDQQQIDRTQVGLGNRVVISAGKTSTSYQDIIHGYVKKVQINRDDTGILYYIFTGYGSQIICNERIIDFQKFASLTSTTTNTTNTTDQSMLAYNLFKTIFEGTSALPLGASPTLIQQGGFTENGIDTRVNDFIPGIQQSLVNASSALNKIADYSGAIWGIQNDDIFFRYPTAIHSGITIKNSVSTTDLANNIAYWTGPYTYIDSCDQTDGFANRIWIKGGAITDKPNISSGQALGYTDLYDKDIAQQIIPDSAQLKNLAVTLSLVGTGGAAGVQYVSGALIQDNGMGYPTGANVMNFQIPLSSIPITPTTVFDFNYKWFVQSLQPNVAYWLVLYAKGTDTSNTVRWWNDGDTTTQNRFSATRQVTLDPSTEDRNQFPLKTDSGGWSVSNTGPVYTHGFFENVRMITEASDPLSINKYGLSEVVHDVQFITDNQTMQEYATSILQSLAKPIRQMSFSYVTIPNNFVWLPGQLVDIVDPLGGIAPPKAISAEIQQVDYSFTATGQASSPYGSTLPVAGGVRQAHPHGATYVSLLCIMYVDFLTDQLF